MDKKELLTLSDLLGIGSEVEVSPGKWIKVKALGLKEIIDLFLRYSESFLGLYSAGVEGNLSAETLTPFLLSCPDMVAEIIAKAMGEPEQSDIVKSHMAGTVQLIALKEIWELSVPDAKKAGELLSGVTAQLQKLSSNIVKKTPASTEPDSLPKT